jgi:hypothetical protein
MLRLLNVEVVRRAVGGTRADDCRRTRMAFPRLAKTPISTILFPQLTTPQSAPRSAALFAFVSIELHRFGFLADRPVLSSRLALSLGLRGR